MKNISGSRRPNIYQNLVPSCMYVPKGNSHSCHMEAVRNASISSGPKGELMMMQELLFQGFIPHYINNV